MQKRAEIRDALENGTQYPWELFARLRADKFLSDIIESPFTMFCAMLRG
jgi:hypothetical protein